MSRKGSPQQQSIHHLTDPPPPLPRAGAAADKIPRAREHPRAGAELPPRDGLRIRKRERRGGVQPAHARTVRGQPGGGAAQFGGVVLPKYRPQGGVHAYACAVLNAAADHLLRQLPKAVDNSIFE
jgi:hypothetical protein